MSKLTLREVKTLAQGHRDWGFKPQCLTLELKLIPTPQPKQPPSSHRLALRLPLVRGTIPKRKMGLAVSLGVWKSEISDMSWTHSLYREQAEGVSFMTVFGSICLQVTDCSSRTAEEDHEGQAGPLPLPPSYVNYHWKPRFYVPVAAITRQLGPASPRRRQADGTPPLLGRALYIVGDLGFIQTSGISLSPPLGLCPLAVPLSICLLPPPHPTVLHHCAIQRLPVAWDIYKFLKLLKN